MGLAPTGCIRRNRPSAHSPHSQETPTGAPPGDFTRPIRTAPILGPGRRGQHPLELPVGRASAHPRRTKQRIVARSSRLNRANAIGRHIRIGHRHCQPPRHRRQHYGLGAGSATTSNVMPN
jgi:hypothetical protein